MKTIKHISLWVVAAAFMVVVPTRGNAQAVSKTYFNVDWQFNAPMGNSYADKASGWGMNFEGGYYVMPHMAIGAYIAYHTNNKYIDRQTLALSSSSALTTDQQHSLFQLPFGLLAKYRFTTSGMFEPYMTQSQLSVWTAPGHVLQLCHQQEQGADLRNRRTQQSGFPRRYLVLIG